MFGFLTFRRVVSGPCRLILLSVPNLGSLPQDQQKCPTPVALGIVRSFHLVSERLDPLESFVGPVSSSSKLKSSPKDHASVSRVLVLVHSHIPQSSNDDCSCSSNYFRVIVLSNLPHRRRVLVHLLLSFSNSSI